MLRLILVLTSLFPALAFATVPGYELSFGLKLKSEELMNTSMVVKKGEKGTLTKKTKTGTTFIEVTPTEGAYLGKSGILLKFVVGTIDHQGVRTIHSKPEVMVGEGSPARVHVKTKSGMKELSLSVNAKRTSTP